MVNVFIDWVQVLGKVLSEPSTIPFQGEASRRAMSVIFKRGLNW